MRQFQPQVLFACPMVAALPPDHPHASGKHANDDLDIHSLAQDTILIPSPEHSPGCGERLEHTCAVAHFIPSASQVLRNFLLMAREVANGTSAVSS